MTAEIAVLNKFGVALATDSAITVDVYHEERIKTKVHNSANKLFTLSKHHPIGVMYYNTVSLSGVPWETIFKIYRKHLSRNCFDTVEEYASDFFRWLSTKDNFFAANQEEYFVGLALRRELVKIDPEFNMKKIDLDKRLDQRIAALERIDPIDQFDEAFCKEIRNKYSGIVLQEAEIAFKDSYINGAKTKIRKYAELVLTRKNLLRSYSGIVFAGYGDRECLPRLIEYKCDLMVLDRPRAWKDKTHYVDGENGSEVVPLADSEAIETLIQGISPGFEAEAYNGVLKLLLELPEKIINPIGSLSDTDKAKFIQDARRSLPRHFKDFYDGIVEYRRKNYTVPIKQSIASLPVSELAQVAESFLAASQILKKVNPDLETIGGPVDVAVISKGDGFIWIKRKHYFNDELNPAFKLRYLDM